MTDLVPRTVTEIGEDGLPVQAEQTANESIDWGSFLSGDDSGARPEPSPTLACFRESSAYVLLGPPGAGKTTVFRTEGGRDGCHYVTARDFLTFEDKPQWQGVTLFIDGLDEQRAGSRDGRTALDGIRARLDKLGGPRFRLSCREADWFGANDRTHLASASSEGKVTELRLDPLSDDGIRKLLNCHPGINDADEFMDEARARGIDLLLTNPQNLEMLADAVSGGTWPETRMQTFELACEKLVREPNLEHPFADQDGPGACDLLDAAGRLCATQLLTGHAGYAPAGGGGDSGYLGLQQIPGYSYRIFRRALNTRLFESPKEGRIAPIHRQIAEFLAARYLAKLIDDGLAIRRVLALMAGEDGGIVSELRGLSAWLAALSKISRAEIIERDPLGTVLYGDVREFSRDEKQQLLSHLEREAKRNPWFANTVRMDARLGSLATLDMREEFEDFLRRPKRDTARQSFVLILLQSLERGQAIPELAELLIEIVRDESWFTSVRHAALHGLIRHQDLTTTAELQNLITDIHTGKVSDPDDDLLGSLLVALYPEQLPVPDVWEYLKIQENPSSFSRYWSFWTQHLPMLSNGTQLAHLLDSLVEQFDRLLPLLVHGPLSANSLRQLPVILLTRFLDTSQESVSSERLFDWLGTVSHPRLSNSTPRVKRIMDWLNTHPDVQKEIIATGVARCIDSARFSHCTGQIKRRLFGATPPGDFGAWCLEQALSTTIRDAASFFIRKVAFALHRGRYDEEISRESVTTRIGHDEVLLSTFLQELANLDVDDAQVVRIRQEDNAIKKRDQRKWHDLVKPHQAALLSNQGEPKLLHCLAVAYFGLSIHADGDRPAERLRSLFGDDHGLVEAVLTGFKGTVSGSDIPDAAALLRLRSEGRANYLALPFLAGLEEQVSTENTLSDEKKIGQALACYYTVPTGQHPSWYKRALRTHPEIAADVLIRSTRAELRDRRREPHTLILRLHDCEQVTRLAVPVLLEQFPVRCEARQLKVLGVLIGTAFGHCENALLLELIERKLAQRAMNVGQRVYWLGAGLAASLPKGLARLEDYVAGRERRIRRLAEFATTADLLGRLILLRDVSAVQLLIRVIGSSFGPGQGSYRSGTVQQFPQLAEPPNYFHHAIDQLASLPSSDATEALEALSNDGALQAWRSRLVDAAYRQRAARREAEFRHPCVHQMVKTLDNRQPANAADLAALTFDHLTELARNIRHGNTNDWRQYWNPGRTDRPWVPKPEDDCRDALLSDLQARMSRLGIDAVPEGRYADEKRSDIRVSSSGFNVPVEIKKSTHRKLWSAVRDQLIAKYARDPGAGGYGIYLVLWFGNEPGPCQMPESGPRPRSAAELEERLRGTLTPEEARLISVCVVDVARP